VHYVGPGSDKTQCYAYPHAWDLAKIEDVNGNAVTFEYTQFVQMLDNAETGLCYTKQSYIKRIFNSDGSRVEFQLADKEASEYQDLMYS